MPTNFRTALHLSCFLFYQNLAFKSKYKCTITVLLKRASYLVTLCLCFAPSLPLLFLLPPPNSPCPFVFFPRSHDSAEWSCVGVPLVVVERKGGPALCTKTSIVTSSFLLGSSHPPNWEKVHRFTKKWTSCPVEDKMFCSLVLL